MPRGRPTRYTPEIADEICQRLAAGEPLAVICRDERMPCYEAVNAWQNGSVRSVPASFSAAIARARVNGIDAIAADARKVARGEEGYSSGDVQRDKLIVETDLKLLAKWDPRRYGDKVQQEISGPDGGSVQQELTIRLVKA